MHLCLQQSLLQRKRSRNSSCTGARPTAILWLHFATDEAVLDYSAIAVCSTRRINMIDAPSYDCLDVAPPGKHLYMVGAATSAMLVRDDLRKPV